METSNEFNLVTTDVQGSNQTTDVNFYNYSSHIAKLSPEEKKKYLAMTSNMSVHDIATVQSYGNELSSVISRNGNNLLEAVRGNNTTAVVELTNDLLAQLNMIDIDEITNNSGFKGFLKRIPIINKLIRSYDNILTKYDSVKENIDKITDKIGNSKIVALRDNSTLQTIFDSNVAYIKQIRDLIIAAKLKFEEVNAKYIKMSQQPDLYEPYQLNDISIFKNALGKKIADMETTEYILSQDLLQIRATQENNYAIADKADNIVTSIIPIWKNQIAIGLIMQNQKNSVDAQKRITDTTNKILKENAKALKINSIAVATANEESIVSLDTLKETTQSLINTIKEVRNIHEKGAQTRMQLEHHLTDFANSIQEAMSAQAFGNRLEQR